MSPYAFLDPEVEAGARLLSFSESAISVCCLIASDHPTLPKSISWGQTYWTFPVFDTLAHFPFLEILLPLGFQNSMFLLSLASAPSPLQALSFKNHSLKFLSVLG